MCGSTLRGSWNAKFGGYLTKKELKQSQWEGINTSSESFDKFVGDGESLSVKKDFVRI